VHWEGSGVEMWDLFSSETISNERFFIHLLGFIGRRFTCHGFQCTILDLVLVWLPLPCTTRIQGFNLS
jgi:hypothetical protein